MSPDTTMDFADGSSYKVKVIGDDGNPVGAGEFVAIKVNGITYYNPLEVIATQGAIIK